MSKLSRPPPIPELDTPGRLEKIVNGLFPKHPKRDTNTQNHNALLEGTVCKIDLTELKTAASRLRNKITPGIDGIPTKSLKKLLL